MKKKAILFSSFLVLMFSLQAQVSFGNADVNQNDEVLFTVRQNVRGAAAYKSLFYAKIKDGTTEEKPCPMTVYPEKMELLFGGKVLQVRNRFGSARYDSEEKSLEWTELYDKMPDSPMPVAEYAVSPNGRYLCKIEKTSTCAGTLLLQSTETGRLYDLCSNVLISYERLPVKWCPDGSMLLYEKNGSIYFCNPDAIMKNVEIDEKYRKIGRGTINSVAWASSKNLAYIDDYLLYRINTKELYTLGLYAGIIGQGKAVGRLPFQFDPQSDYFEVNRDVNAIVTVQTHKLVTYMKVQSVNLDYMDVLYSRPYTDSSASLVGNYVLWNAFGEPILWQEKLPYDGSSIKCAVYRLNSMKSQQVLEIQDSGKPYVSPDGNKVAFFAGAMLYVYDVNSWRRISELSGEKLLSVLWRDDDTLYVGGEKSIRLWNCLENLASTVTLSTANSGYWDVLDNSIVAETTGAQFYKRDMVKGTWRKLERPGTYLGQSQNGRYRVFSGTTANKNYANAIYIRKLGSKAVTTPIFQESVEKLPARQKVALVIDLYDNADGLPQILSVLKKYNLPAVFFLNGEFIRRYGSETNQIVKNGYECASMFFSMTDLTDDSFVINEDFVRRGLARNEDEFYAATGSELSLFWHTPNYKISEDLVTWGASAGYTYIDSFVHVKDYQSADEPAGKVISNYYDQLKKIGGGIIPVTGGFSQGRHVHPLYDHLDLLISVLTQGGFEFVELKDL